MYTLRWITSYHAVLFYNTPCGQVVNMGQINKLGVRDNDILVEFTAAQPTINTVRAMAKLYDESKS